MKLNVKSKTIEPILIEATEIASKKDNIIRIVAEPIDYDPILEDPDNSIPVAGSLRIMAYNDIITCEWSCPIELFHPGSATLHPDGIKKLIKISKTHDTHFGIMSVDTPSGSVVRIITSKSTHDFLVTEDNFLDEMASYFSETPQTNYTHLAMAINNVRQSSAKAGDTTGAKIAQTGIHIKPIDEYMHIVATDGVRMAITRLNNNSVDLLDFGIHQETGIVVPGGAIDILTSLLLKSSCSIKIEKNCLIVCGDNLNLSIRLIEVAFPNYNIILQHTYDKLIKLNKEDLTTALSRSAAEIIKENKTNIVDMTQQKEGIYITSRSKDNASFERISAELKTDIKLAYRAGFMLDAIASFPESKHLLFHYGDQQPIMISSEEEPGTNVYVMPQK